MSYLNQPERGKLIPLFPKRLGHPWFWPTVLAVIFIAGVLVAAFK